MSWEEVKIDPQGSIQLDKYHTWYRKYPNLLLYGMYCKFQEFFYDEFINYY